jgi:hypothetical protein
MSLEKRLEKVAKERGLRLRRSRSGRFRVQDAHGLKRSKYMSLRALEQFLVDHPDWPKPRPTPPKPKPKPSKLEVPETKPQERDPWADENTGAHSQATTRDGERP